jgi:hypothetical protein
VTPIPPFACVSLAVAFAFVMGAVVGLCALDWVMWKLLGNTATVSHAMWLLGANYRWLPWAWVAGGVSVTLGLAWHFWWS